MTIEEAENVNRSMKVAGIIMAYCVATMIMLAMFDNFIVKPQIEMYKSSIDYLFEKSRKQQSDILFLEKQVGILEIKIEILEGK